MIIEDNIIDNTLCDFCINEITSSNRWAIGSDIDGNQLKENYGHILMSYEIDTIDFRQPEFIRLNTMAEYILNLVTDNKLIDENFSQLSIKRIYWNHYNENGYVPLHTDIEETSNYIQDGSKALTLLLHLNDSDACNIVNNEKIKTKKGRILIFPSKNIHGSTPPKSSAHRFTCNIVFTIL